MLTTSRQHIILIALGTLMAAFSLVSIILFSDPTVSGWLTFLFFYLSGFLAALGIFTLLGIGIRRFSKAGLFMSNVSVSFRQAFLVSLLITLSLYLQSAGLLYWWVQLSLIAFFVFVEGFLNLKT